MVLQDDRKEIRTPTDLGGVIMQRYDATNKSLAEQSITEACTAFRERISHNKRRKLLMKLATSWYYDVPTAEFKLRVDAARLQFYQATIGEQLLLVVARVSDTRVDGYEDRQIAKTGTRRYRADSEDNIEFYIKGSDITNLEPGCKIEATVLLAPDGLDPAKMVVWKSLKMRAVVWPIA